jgi:hypothetical protein
MAHTLHTTCAFVHQLYIVWCEYHAVQEHTLSESVHYTEQSHKYIHAYVAFRIENCTKVLHLLYLLRGQKQVRAIRGQKQVRASTTFVIGQLLS